MEQELSAVELEKQKKRQQNLDNLAKGRAIKAANQSQRKQPPPPPEPEPLPFELEVNKPETPRNFFWNDSRFGRKRDFEDAFFQPPPEPQMFVEEVLPPLVESPLEEAVPEPPEKKAKTEESNTEWLTSLGVNALKAFVGTFLVIMGQRWARSLSEKIPVEESHEHPPIRRNGERNRFLNS